MTRKLSSEGPKFGDLFPSTPTLRNVLAFFDAIDEAGGTAGRWWLERKLTFAGNTVALDRWLVGPAGLLKKGYLMEVKLEDGSKGYQKTEAGKVFHNALKDHEHVKIYNDIIKHYSKDRLTR